MLFPETVVVCLMAVGVLLTLSSQVWILVVLAQDGLSRVLVYFLLFPFYMVFLLSWHEERYRLPKMCLFLGAGLEFVAFILGEGLSGD